MAAGDAAAPETVAAGEEAIADPGAGETSEALTQIAPDDAPAAAAPEAPAAEEAPVAEEAPAAETPEENPDA